MNFLKQDILSKEALSKTMGGTKGKKVCGCVCVGQVVSGEEFQEDSHDCIDSGAANAHRVLN